MTDQIEQVEQVANVLKKSSGEDCRAELSFIQIAGCMASASVVEENLLGTN